MIIGCRLPHGLILTVGNKSVTLNGLNKVTIIGATYATTEVDNDFWAAWKAQHADFPALKNGAIFEAKTPADAQAKASEVSKEPTGLEPLKPDSGGVQTLKD